MPFRATSLAAIEKVEGSLCEGWGKAAVALRLQIFCSDSCMSKLRVLDIAVRNFWEH